MSELLDLPQGWQDRLVERLANMTAEERQSWFDGYDADIARIKARFDEIHQADRRREAREFLRHEEEQLAARQRLLDDERRQVAERLAAIGK